MSNTYPLAQNGIFKTVQGEGVLLGMPMVFVRLAGCSVGCSGCDTDYRIAIRQTAFDIAVRALEVADGAEWVWITGGEPTDHDLIPLIAELRRAGFRIALATAGTRPVQVGSAWGGVDFLSVSPHSVDGWVQRRGDQVNLVPGLNGLRLDNWEPLVHECESGFFHRFVTPFWYAPGERVEKVRECLDWIAKHPGWRVGIQGHKVWGLP